MRKIYNLLAIASIAVSFTACKPMDDTYKELGSLPFPTPAPIVKSETITLSAADYALLPASNPAKTALSFQSLDEAKTSIPVILAAKYPSYGDKSAATVTYATSPITIKVADSTFTNVAYTLAPTDYNNNFGSFSSSQVLSWLPVKYPNADANQLAVLTFNFFESGATNVATQSFLYLGGSWRRIYHVSPAQYASVGKGGNNNNFASADASLLPQYFNIFLKADPAVSVNAKAGDVQYVSFKYYGGSAANTFQRVLPLTFDGANWVTTPVTTKPIIFTKTKGVWIADNTVNYTLSTNDVKAIAAIPNIASAAAMANAAQFGNFALTGNNAWTADQIAAGIIATLKTKYPNAEKDQKFVITYAVFGGTSSTQTKTFNFDGTNFTEVK